jgi:magnesium chelatase family protein
LHVDVDAVNPWEMKTNENAHCESSAQIRERVVAARKRQISRQGYVNALLDGADMDKYVVLNDELTTFLNSAAEKMGMSARGYNRIKRIARTIADLRGDDNIIMSDIAEALSYRPINRGKYGVKH